MQASPDLPRGSEGLTCSRSGLEVSLRDHSTLEAQWPLRELDTLSARVYLLPTAEGAHHGEVVVAVVRKALEGLAEQGGTDARVQLVEQASQVEGWLDAR